MQTQGVDFKMLGIFGNVEICLNIYCRMKKNLNKVVESTKG